MKTARSVLLHGALLSGFAALTMRSLRLEMGPATVVYAALGLLSLGTLPFALRKRRGRVYYSVTNALILALLIPAILSAALYESFFFRRFETPSASLGNVRDYPGLLAEESPFPTDHGRRLAGVLYRREGEAKAVAVLAHGYGTGHRGYLGVVDALARAGYVVFAYDATACDASPGRSARGLPQAAIDLEAALDHVATLPDVSALPLVLIGHSWGGYAVGCAADMPRVRAVISLAGFDRSTDIIRAQGQRLIGGAIEALLPCLSLYERLKFGARADMTAAAGFEKSAARVLIVHSADDATVPIALGLDRYEAAFSGDPRFTFLRLEGRGHENLFTSRDAQDYIAFFDEALS